MVLILIVTISRESTGGKIVYKRTASYTYPQTSDMTDKLNSDRTTGKHNQVDIEWMLY